MTRYFVSRHPGAMQWLERRGVSIDAHLAHLEGTMLVPGDQVIGTLPLQLACWVSDQGADYWHLSLNIPREWRGEELSAEQMEVCGARLEAFTVRRAVADVELVPP